MLKVAVLVGFFALAWALIGCGGGGSTTGGGTSGSCSPPPAAPVPGLATLTGRVVVDFTGLGVNGILIRFYNASAVQVGSVTTDSCGYFVATVPSNSVRFHLEPTSINASLYYRQFTYAAKRYAATISTCTAPLPALTDNTVTALPGGSIVLPSTAGPPPPPPNGCS